MKLSKLGCRRKGALDVSINSIVVIVFAVTMLGLGLAFMKGYFSKIGVQTLPETPEPSPGDPITIPQQTIIMDRASSVEFSVKFYNENPSSFNFATAAGGAKAPSVTCYSGNSQALDVGLIKVTTSPLPVAYATSAEFPMKLSLDKKVTSGTYPCSFIFTTEAQTPGTGETCTPACTGTGVTCKKTGSGLECLSPPFTSDVQKAFFIKVN